VGVGLGAYSKSLWSKDHPVIVNGATQHSLSHVEGVRANNYAYAANAMFVAAGVLAVGTGVIAYVQGGFGFSGRF
jgi:hypothetical protein